MALTANPVPLRPSSRGFPPPPWTPAWASAAVKVVVGAIDKPAVFPLAVVAAAAFVLFVDEEEAEAGNASALVAEAEAPVFASTKAKTFAKAFCINGVCRRVACSSGVMRRLRKRSQS